jgi:hypothetical protein
MVSFELLSARAKLAISRFEPFKRSQQLLIVSDSGYPLEPMRGDPGWAPRIEFAEKKDAFATVMKHWLANLSYKDPRLLPGFPVGSNDMGG